MPTSTLTLSDFLLARIAEDEARAARYHRLAVEVGDAYGSPEPPDDLNAANRSYFALHEAADRIMAECKAKRRLVKAFPPSTYFGGPSEHFALHYLAAVYADHPDYNPDWAV